jgi:hypothetical protein
VVERDWKPRGFSCSVFTDPPGKASSGAMLLGTTQPGTSSAVAAPPLESAK